MILLSIGKVSKMFGISRTTLLYYDKIGLFAPSARSASGYRLYDQLDIAKNVRNDDINIIKKIIDYAEIDLDKRNLWHTEFKKQSPELHDYFLSVLKLNDEIVEFARQTIKRTDDTLGGMELYLESWLQEVIDRFKNQYKS